MVNSVSKFFGDKSSTLGTELRCPSWIYFNKFSVTSFFRFVIEKVKELRPCYIKNTFIQTVIGIVYHLLNFQIFNKDSIVVIDNRSARFVKKIKSLIFNFVMQSLQLSQRMFGFMFRIFTLQLFELHFTLLKNPRIFDYSFIRQSCKVFATNINTNVFLSYWKWFDRNFIARENCIKFIRFSFDSNSFDNTFNFSMKFNSDCSDILNVKFPFFKFSSIAVNKGDRIKSILAFESWIPWFVTFFNSSKECCKRFIQTLKNILAYTRVEFSNSFLKRSYFRNRFCLFVITDKFFPLFPTNDFMFKSTIIKEFSGVQELFKSLILCSIGVKTEFKRFPHCIIYNMS